METFKFPNDNKKVILALGAESAGNFSVFHKGNIYFSEDFGDLLENTNFNKYKHELNEFIKKNKVKPYIILTDLHPLYKTTELGKELAKKYKAKHIQVQHHIAHIFSAIGDQMLQTKNYKLKTSIGIALDGTGYGLDGKIWGGELFKISNFKFQISNKIQSSRSKKLNISRIGKLEDQIMISGDLAVNEPARMLISIFSKFLNKEEIYKYTKKYYAKNKFEVLYNQLQQNFNCVETSSTGRVLDAVSVLLGFCDNKRNYKHEPIDSLEKNSTKPYSVRPEVIYDKKEKMHISQTTPLFQYLIKNLGRNKKRLAATAQLYIVQGLYEIIKCSGETATTKDIFIAGGIANNKIISSYLGSKDAYKNKKIPRGDAGLSFGQIIYYFLADPRN